MATSDASNQHFPFFDLPRELRDQVYDYLDRDMKSKLYREGGKHDSRVAVYRERALCTSILLSSHKLALEYRDRFDPGEVLAVVSLDAASPGSYIFDAMKGPLKDGVKRVRVRLLLTCSCPLFKDLNGDCEVLADLSEILELLPPQAGPWRAEVPLIELELVMFTLHGALDGTVKIKWTVSEHGESYLEGAGALAELPIVARLNLYAMPGPAYWEEHPTPFYIDARQPDRVVDGELIRDCLKHLASWSKEDGRTVRHERESTAEQRETRDDEG